MWYRNWDDQPFETEEEAREAACQDMTFDDYCFYTYFDFQKVLKWCFKQEEFIKVFSNEIEVAQNDYFEENFIEEEEED